MSGARCASISVRSHSLDILYVVADRTALREATSGGFVMKLGIPVYEGVNLLDVAGPLEMFYWAGR